MFDLEQAFHEQLDTHLEPVTAAAEGVRAGVGKRAPALQALEVAGQAATNGLNALDPQLEDAPVAQGLELALAGGLDAATATIGADVATAAVASAKSDAVAGARTGAQQAEAQLAKAVANDAPAEVGQEQAPDEAAEGEEETGDGEAEEGAAGEGEDEADEGEDEAEDEAAEGEAGEANPEDAAGPLNGVLGAGLGAGGAGALMGAATGLAAGASHVGPGGAGLSAAIDLAGASQEAMAAVTAAVAEPARIIGALELPTLAEMAPKQAEQWQAEHGVTPDVHQQQVAGQLDGLVHHARTQFEGLGSQGQQLRQTLEGTGQQVHQQVEQAEQQAASTVTGAYQQASAQVAQGAQQAQTQVSGAASQARTGVRAAHSQAQVTATQTRTQVLASIELKKTAAIAKLGLEIEAKAAAIEKVGTDQGTAAQTKCEEVAGEFAAGGGDAKDRLRADLKAKSARNASAGYVQRFKATADRYAAGAREQKVVGTQLIEGFATTLVQRLDAGHEQGMQRTEQRVTQAEQSLDGSAQASTQAAVAAGAQASQVLQQGETADTATLTGEAQTARATMQQQLAQAQTGTAEAVEGARRRHGRELEGVQAGLDSVQGRPNPEAVRRSILYAQAHLETTQGMQVAALQSQHQTTEQGIRQQAQQRGQQVAQAAAQRGQAAQQQGAAQLQQVQQSGAAAQQSLTAQGSRVSGDLQQAAAPVTLANAEQQADAGFEQIIKGVTDALERQRAGLDQQLGQQVNGVAQTVGAAGDRAADSKLAEVGRKATLIRNAADGWGTDESALLGALAGLTPVESQVMQALYLDHYGTSLRSQITDELSGDDLNEALAHLSGNRVDGALERLNNSISWTGDDEAAIEQSLRGLTPEELTELRQRMEDDPRAAAIIERVRDNLGGHDLDVTDALMQGNQAQADAIRLHEAMDGMGTDEAAVYRILENAPPERRAAIQAEYAQYASTEDGVPSTLEGAIRDDFGGAEQDLGLALMDGDRVGATAARLEIAADGMGTDEAEIFKRLDDPRLQSNDPREVAAAQAERDQLRTLYEARYGRSLDTMIAAEMGDASDQDNYEAQVATQYLENGRVEPALAIRYATDGVGTDEDMVKNALRGLSAEDVAALRAEFGDGEELNELLASELSGAEGHEVDVLMMGKPETPEQFMEIARMRHEFQRGSGTDGMDFFEAIGATESGATLDANYARAQAFYDNVDWANATPEQQQRMRELSGFVNDDAASYQAAKDSITDGVVTAIELTGAIVATIVTAGAASPALAAVICAGATGAAVIGAKAAIQGNSYGQEALMTDLGQTAINMATAGLGSASSVRDAAGRYGAAVASRLPGSAQWVDNVIAMGIEGAVGGSLDSVGRAVLNDQAWDQGIEAWASQMAVAGVQGGVSGFVGGAAGADMEGYFGAAQTGMRSAVREGFANMAGDGAALLFDPNTYSQDIDNVLRSYFKSVPQSFATGAIGSYGAGMAASRRADSVGMSRAGEEGRDALPSRREAPGSDADGTVPMPRPDADTTVVRPDADATVVRPDADATVVQPRPDAGDTVVMPQPDAGDTVVMPRPDAGDTVVMPQADADATVVQPRPDAGDTVVLPRPDATAATPETQPRPQQDVKKVDHLQKVGEPDAGTSDAYIMVDPNTGQRFLFKPSEGDAPVMRAQEAGIEQGTYGERAVAGGALSEALGIATPKVRLVEIDGQVGSLQQWVPNATSMGELGRSNPEAHQRVLADPEYQRQRAGVDALDYLMNNLDRNSGNLLVITDDQGNFKQLVPIDHDLTFTPGQERTVMEGWARGLPDQYDPAIRLKLAQMAADPQALRDRLESVLPAAEVDAVMHRLNDLLGDMRGSAGVEINDIPGDVMGAHQRSRIEGALAGMSHGDHAIMTQLLSHAGGPRERGVLLKAATAGSSMAEIRWMANQIRGKSDSWLQLMTTLSDAQAGDRGAKQQWHDTCGVTTAQVLRGEYDPLYALKTRLDNPDIHLVDDSDANAQNPTFAAEQQSMTETPYSGEMTNMAGHAGVPVARDQAGGSGRFLDDLFNAIETQTGNRYSPHLDPDPAFALNTLDTALANGQIVPVIVGSGPRSYGHYVLATDVRVVDGKREFLFHEPWDGVTVWRTEADILAGQSGLAGWGHITGIEVPQSMPDQRPAQGDSGVAGRRADATAPADADVTATQPLRGDEDATVVRPDVEETMQGDDLDATVVPGAAKDRGHMNSAGVEVNRRTVDDHDALLSTAEAAAGGSLDHFTEFKPGWYEGVHPETGARMKIEWETVGHANTNEGPHVTVRVWDPTKGRKGGWRVTEKAFIHGQETFN
jgi:hypothetical protein